MVGLRPMDSIRPFGEITNARFNMYLTTRKLRVIYEVIPSLCISYPLGVRRQCHRHCLITIVQFTMCITHSLSDINVDQNSDRLVAVGVEKAQVSKDATIVQAVKY